jgi:hypothetical protein
MKEIQSVNDDLLVLEQALRAKLHPITPNQDFVGNLRGQLESSPIYQRQQDTAHLFLTLAGGLLVGLTVFLVGRGIFQGLRET